MSNFPHLLVVLCRSLLTLLTACHDFLPLLSQNTACVINLKD
ncbi:hypothetical protein ENHAE0001_2031 [Enhydrobacter aerosaccus SK60]|nr:hypothetical protein ENHAE0001_2031 [Enhydrobacter aerosaccus SK60]